MKYIIAISIALSLCACGSDIPREEVKTKSVSNPDTIPIPDEGLSVTIEIDTTCTEYVDNVYFPI